MFVPPEPGVGQVSNVTRLSSLYGHNGRGNKAEEDVGRRKPREEKPNVSEPGNSLFSSG